MATILVTLNFSFIRLLNFKNMNNKKLEQLELTIKQGFTGPEISRRSVWQ